MADFKAEPKMEVHGSVVAFEGQPDIVSTQLRLLPTSPQIFILPAIQYYLPSADLEEAFNIRTYVLTIHRAIKSRLETALNFLRGATATNKRLVFMNGGTPTAQSLCIKAIMRHETGGDRTEAEAFFKQLVKDGLSSIEVETQVHDSVSSVGYGDDDELQDPITRAMRAADALDRQTANLQPCDMLDLTMTTRPRSLSLPLYGYSDGFGDAAPFFLFGAHYEDESCAEVEEDAPTFSAIDYSQAAPKTTRQYSLDLTPEASPSCIGESYYQPSVLVRRDAEILSPTSDGFSLRTNDPVVFGEASLLDLRKSISMPKGSLRRIKSLDRIYPFGAKLRDLCIPDGSSETTEETSLLRRPHSFMVSRNEMSSNLGGLNFVERPRTIIVKGKRPSIKIDPVPLERKNINRRNTARASYVNRGTDASPPGGAPFQPLLPFSEDLVVYFKDESPDSLMASLIKAFKIGDHPISSLSKTLPLSDVGLSTPETPLSYSLAPDHAFHYNMESPSTVPIDGEDYNPFAFSSSWDSKAEKLIPTVNIVRPPTPAQTPPPYTAKGNKLHEFEIMPSQTAVTIQNSLRSVLSVYFPPEAEGYRQFQFSLLPEFDGLWKPIFRESESRDSQKENNRRVDQILAIGSQQGVKKEYSSGIIKQLEKIGTKSSDAHCRSGRVDFRYLLANAMQTFTALPLTNQTSDNPFTNSYLMATLIIPHLETYLALHSEIRYLLLEYPPEHLPTVLALQKLVGMELIKVAQIVDSANKNSQPFTQIGGRSVSSVGSKSENKMPSLSPRSSNSDITMTKANFLLTSTATDADIAKFVSTVWNIPAETSDSDHSDWRFKEKMLRRRKNKLAPLNTFTAFPRSSMSSQGGLSPSSPSMPSRSSSPAQSLLDNIKTLKSDQITRGHTFSHRRALGKDSLSAATVDGSDSELDEEERRLMPMFMKPIERTSNTRKALKFLGLA